MSSRTYGLIPVDTWFFRDGRPYNQGEANQTGVISLFPPFATTVVGAIRAGLARSMGWSGRGDWPSFIKDRLGDGPDLGPLMFKGPCMVRLKGELSEPLFTAPLHLLGRPPEDDGDGWKLTRLSPGVGVDCDLGNRIRLPAAKDATGMKPLTGYFLSPGDLAKVLQDGDLKGVRPVSEQDLWEMEYSVGIQRDFQTRTTGEDAMYSRHNVRLKKDVALAVEVDGLEDDVVLPITLPLGGEGRLAWAEPLVANLKPPDPPSLREEDDGRVRFTVTHLTPVYFNGGWPGPGDCLPGVPGAEVVSACLERPLRIGGWDSVRNQPLPLRPFLPPGSTWFCEAREEHAENIRQSNGMHLGSYWEQGYGQIAIGSWNDYEGVSK